MIGAGELLIMGPLCLVVLVVGGVYAFYVLANLNRRR